MVYSTPGDKLSWRYRYNYIIVIEGLTIGVGVRKKAEGNDPLRGISAGCSSGSESRSPLLDACVTYYYRAKEGGAVSL